MYTQTGAAEASLPRERAGDPGHGRGAGRGRLSQRDRAPA